MPRRLSRLFRACSPRRWFARRTPRPTTGRVQLPLIRRGCGTTLEAVGLLRSFGTGDGQTVAVRDVSLVLRHGDMNLLMGPSGSGKSTLLAVLSALLRPDAGHVRAHGSDIWRMNETELEKFRLRHCSYVFQGYNLFPALTARQQLEVVLRWGERAGPAEARRRAERVLGQLGMTRKAHLRPAELSGGEKQRVAIARALVKDPTFVFADEPTAALDWENGRQVIELFRGVARDRGATVLVVTHDPRLLPYADRVIEMADGELREDTTEATNSYHLDRTAIELTPVYGPRLKLREPAYYSAAE